MKAAAKAGVGVGRKEGGRRCQVFRKCNPAPGSHDEMLIKTKGWGTRPAWLSG